MGPIRTATARVARKIALLATSLALLFGINVIAALANNESTLDTWHAILGAQLPAPSAAPIAVYRIAQDVVGKSDLRVALVIGNSNYSGDDRPLDQPVRDARALAEELRRVGFDVIVGEDFTKQKMRAAIENFEGKIKPGSAALIFFSGYGIQVGRQSYIMPVDAQVATEGEVRRDGVRIESVLAEMKSRGAAVKLIIIDAARRNPFERRFRSHSAGLASLDAPAGTLAMYSAAPEKVENDTDGENGLFVGELLKEMRTPGQSAEQIFSRTRIGVSRASNNEQVPWVSSSLADDFYFSKQTAVLLPATLPAPSESPSPAQSPQPPVLPQVAAENLPTAAPPAPPTASEPNPTSPPTTNPSSAPIATPTPTASISPLDVALDKLVAGHVAFNTPERMTVGTSQIVEAKLSLSMSPVELISRLGEAGRKESADLRVGDRMAATLTGGAAFDISPSGPQIQWISQKEVTTWTWDVTPKTSGTQYLILSFDALITVNGKDGTRNVNTLKRKIEVEVGWPQTAGEWFELAKKWLANLTWVWASILVPAAVFAVGWWRKRSRPRKLRHHLDETSLPKRPPGPMPAE